MDATTRACLMSSPCSKTCLPGGCYGARLALSWNS